MSQYTINLRELYPVWKIRNQINSTTEECLDYMLFIASPLLTGQATTLGVAMRRTLLENIQGTAIIAAKIYGAAHEYSTLEGIQESIHDILLNLKQVIIKNKICELQKVLISVIGPKKVIAADIKGSDDIIISNPSHHIATITQSIQFDVELIIQTGRGYLLHDGTHIQPGYFPVDALFNPVRNVNFSIHSLAEQQEALILEIWTNGSISPLEALREASENLIHLFLPPFRLTDDSYMTCVNTRGSDMEMIKLSNKQQLDFPISEEPQNSNLITEQSVEYSKTPIELLELSTRPFKCLKNANIYTINDLLKLSQQDLLKIANMGPSSVKQIVDALERRFGIVLKNK